MEVYSSTPVFNETFKTVNINVNMDIGLNKECPWLGDSFCNAIFSFCKYMPLPESGFLFPIYLCHYKDRRKPFTILCMWPYLRLISFSNRYKQSYIDITSRTVGCMYDWYSGGRGFDLPNVLDEDIVFIMPSFPSWNICLYLNQEFCSQCIYSIIKIVGNHLLFCVCDRT